MTIKTKSRPHPVAGARTVSGEHRTRNTAMARGGKGRDNHMLPPQAASPAERGRSADTTRADDVPGKRFAAGGDAGKFPTSPPGAKPAVAGRTSPITQPTRSSTSTRDYPKAR
jgi:hypothetical protein